MDILLPENETAKQTAINKAALAPPLFSEIWNHFEHRIPSDEALKTHLLRRDFNNRAIDPVMKSFAPTMAMTKQQDETESGSIVDENRAESHLPPSEEDCSEGVSASIGDYVQWENQGVLQFQEPKRVRWVSEDGDYLAVDGSTSGIPMNEVTISEKPNANPGFFQSPPQEELPIKSEAGFTEWFRAKVGADKLVTINYRGADEIGPREIEKMIAILQAQKIALED